MLGQNKKIFTFLLLYKLFSIAITLLFTALYSTNEMVWLTCRHKTCPKISYFMNMEQKVRTIWSKLKSGWSIRAIIFSLWNGTMLHLNASPETTSICVTVQSVLFHGWGGKKHRAGTDWVGPGWVWWVGEGGDWHKHCTPTSWTLNAQRWLLLTVYYSPSHCLEMFKWKQRRGVKRYKELQQCVRQVETGQKVKGEREDERGSQWSCQGWTVKTIRKRWTIAYITTAARQVYPTTVRNC